MFVGHLGVGLALKKVEPELNLGVLFFASLFLDLLLGFFVLAGFEQVVVPENYSQLHYLKFSFPYSHSLLGALVWSVVALAVTYKAWPGDTRAKIKTSIVISAAVFIHWLCDWLEHPSQLPFAGNASHMLGLGLWDHLHVALTLEVFLAVIGTAIYLKVARKIGRTGRWGIVMLMMLITIIAVMGQLTVTQAPGQNAVAISMIVQTLIISGMATWIERNRVKAV